MMSDIFKADDDATPLMMEEIEQLKLHYISSRNELNAAEQKNISKAFRWALSSRGNLLTESYLKKLHNKMFSDVWKWAGQYRTSERNIGIEAYRIQTSLHQLLNDVNYWIMQESFCLREVLARFHHQLVFIHPFPNGNGRFSRLATDLLAE